MQSLNSSKVLCLITYHSLVCCYRALTAFINLYFVSYNQAEYEPIECVHTSNMRTHSLCYRNRECKKMKAFPFFKPPNQVKLALFYIRIMFIRIVRLGVTVI